MDPGDNGIYVIGGWKIVDRVDLYEGFVEQDEYDFDEMLRHFDASMPESDRLGELLDSVEVPVSEVELGDEVWMFTPYGDWRKFPVVGARTAGAQPHLRVGQDARRRDGRDLPRPALKWPCTTTAATSPGTATTTSTAMSRAPLCVPRKLLKCGFTYIGSDSPNSADASHISK